MTNKAQQTIRFYFCQNVCERAPYNFYYQICNIIEQSIVKRQIKEAENMSFGATRVFYDGRECYVLAIGESCRYDNMSLAGYTRKTTPELEKLDNLVLFSNYYSTACLTMYSVPQILTRATPLDYELNYREKSVFKPFQECEFKTFFIAHESNLLSYEEYLSDGSDELIVVNRDIDIPAKIDSLVKLYPKTFFVTQFLGNHNSYRNFDKAHDVFHPNPISDDIEWTSEEANINAYDNTMLYTDFILSSIIKNIDAPETRSAFLFVSDHGEDYKPGTGGHGGSANPDKSEYHVPFIVWVNNNWKECFPELFQNLDYNKSLPINADNVFYSVCDIGGISLSSEYSKQEWSVFSKHMQLHERFILLPDGKNVRKVE